MLIPRKQLLRAHVRLIFVLMWTLAFGLIYADLLKLYLTCPGTVEFRNYAYTCNLP